MVPFRGGWAESVTARGLNGLAFSLGDTSPGREVKEMNRDELKEKAREAFRKAESSQEASDKAVMRSRYNLDMAEASFTQAEDVVKEAGAAEDSAAALSVNDAHQKYLDAENTYQHAKAGNEESRSKLEQSRAKFAEKFGEQP